MDIHEHEQGTAVSKASSLGETRQLLRRLEGLGEVKAPASIIPAVLGRVGLADAYFSLESAIGPVFVAFNDRGISAVMPAMGPSGFEEAFQARTGRRARRIDRPPGELARAMAAQLAGARPHGLHFDLRGLSEFEQAVLRKALEIPRGEVRPYVWIAAEIERPGGSPRWARHWGATRSHCSSRAIGWCAATAGPVATRSARRPSAPC